MTKKPSESTDKETKKLILAYSSLDNEDKRIVELIAVVYIGTSQTSIQRLLKNLEWKTSSGKSLSGILVKSLREKLERKKLISYDNNLIILNPKIVDYLTQIVIDKGLYKEIAVAAEAVIPFVAKREPVNHITKSVTRLNHQLTQRALRDVRFMGHANSLLNLLGISKEGQLTVNTIIADELLNIVGKPLTKIKLEQYQTEVQLTIIIVYLIKEFNSFSLSKELYEHFEALSADKNYLIPYQFNLLIDQRMLRLQLKKAKIALDKEEFFGNISTLGWWLTLTGEYEAAIEAYKKSLKETSKALGKRNVYMPGLRGAFFLIALMSCSRPKEYALLEKQIETAPKIEGFYQDFCTPILGLLGETSSVLQGKMRIEDAEILIGKIHRLQLMPLLSLFQAMALYWLGEKERITSQNTLKKHCLQAYENGYYWYAFEASLLLETLIENKEIASIASAAKKHEFVPVFSIITPVEPWMRTLEALKNIPNQLESQVSELRMVWWLYYSKDWKHFRLEPREQKMTKKGAWSKGRTVSLRRLYMEQESYEYLTPLDKKICSAIEHCSARYYGYPNDEFTLDSEDALIKAAGHPGIFWESETHKPVEILQGDPELHISETDQQVRIQMSPMAPEIERTQKNVLIQKEHTHRLKVIQFNDQHLRIASLLGKDGLSVPSNAKERVLESISAIAPLLTIHSDISGHDSMAERVDANQRLQIHIQHLQDGFHIHWYIQPFAPKGPLFSPGQGGKTVFTEVKDKKLQATRDLDQEYILAKELMNGFPENLRSEISIKASEFEWFVPDLEIALELLCYLNSLQETADIHWPEGQKLKIAKEIQKEDMSVSVRSQQDWFELSGKLSVDENNILDMEKLLELMNETPGRFIRLDTHSFIALTEELRHKLDKLKAYTEGGKFHLLASQAVEEITDGMEINSCKQWETILKKFNEAEHLTFKVPSTLQAELRDYQIQGFEWMSRLSHWGAGACLADDMGLGKTLQALSVILTRAPEGPTLVLAPTSVCMNWREEASRFAPTLNPQIFSQYNNRENVKQAGNFDLVICSYGLLQTNIELLKKIQWRTIIADEAQAIKNPQAKRTKAAMELDGDFKIALTGTPIENHLGELWSLFRFINPGLLGPLERFNNRFAYAIENNKDDKAKNNLRKLTQPFILRRHKNQVLKELPPRTNISINVALSKEETVFYEALRQKAVKRIESTDEPSSKKRFLVLTEIMKLRRACCNASMVLPDANIKSSKLEALTVIIEELIENRHKALIFSQFVDHLKIIRELLDGRGIAYQYLDGQTPEKKRKQSVDAFQAGEGDIFLISLKAGGVGLNLTAADYVIHMDPWWNPAVEDQASDRAHRMGQKRPVTIYRLITSSTIEEKIVKLHDHKRDLATSLLEGNDFSGRISVDEMMQLIKH